MPVELSLTDVHVWRWEGRCQDLGGTRHGTWSLPGMAGSRMRAVGTATEKSFGCELCCVCCCACVCLGCSVP